VGRPFSPQNCPSAWGIWSPSNTYFLGPTPVHNRNDISIGLAVFAGLTIVTDRPTDHATRSVTIGRILYVVLQCGQTMHKTAYAASYSSQWETWTTTFSFFANWPLVVVNVTRGSTFDTLLPPFFFSLIVSFLNRDTTANLVNRFMSVCAKRMSYTVAR